MVARSRSVDESFVFIEGGFLVSLILMSDTSQHLYENVGPTYV